MIIGNGLIANAFEEYRYNDDVLIFASGVSNSMENNEFEFNKEYEMLKEANEYPSKLVYFSTCSIVDDSKKSPYILHKMEMEKFIIENSKNYLIFRLPIVVGNTNNKNTFFNNIRNKIINKEIINIHITYRYLIDVQDLSKYLPEFIKNDKNLTINICLNNKMTVIDIINIISNELKIKVNAKFVESIINKDIDNSYFMSKISKIVGNEYLPEYNKILINKYINNDK
jgi:dTDP-4-dehydrorhamnose reductase